MIAQPGHAIASRPSTRPTYRHIQAQHEAARGGTRRRLSGAITAHCSGAHQRMRMAVSLCSGPQHALQGRRHTQTTQKNKAPQKPPAPPPSPLSAPRGRPRCPPCPFLSRMVPATHTTDSNHRSEAVLEHSHRSGAQEHDHDQGGRGVALEAHWRQSRVGCRVGCVTRHLSEWAAACSAPPFSRSIGGPSRRWCEKNRP